MLGNYYFLFQIHRKSIEQDTFCYNVTNVPADENDVFFYVQHLLLNSHVYLLSQMNTLLVHILLYRR